MILVDAALVPVLVAVLAVIRRIVLALLLTVAMRMGISESVHELRSMIVGTINGNGTRFRRSWSRSIEAFGP